MDENLNLSKYQDKKLIAFDLYGTCIDHPSKNIGMPLDLKNIVITQPITLKEIEEKGQDFGDKFRINDVIEQIKKDISGTFLFPETLETLKYIKSRGYQTAVVSNLSKDYANPLHKLIPEGNFDYEVLSFDVGAAKPDPQIYEYLKSLSGIDFKDIIMIGDSLKSDVIGSHNVGISPIHLNRNEEGIKEVHKKGIDFIQISTLADLKKIL